MHCHCGTNNRAPRWTFTDPCKAEVRPGAREESASQRASATGVACRQGTLTLPDTWFRPPFWDLLMLQLLRPNSSNLPCLYSTFHLEYPLVLSRFCLIYTIHMYSGHVRTTILTMVMYVYLFKCNQSLVERDAF